MHTITYVSSAVKPFSQQELVELLTLSREANARHGITGMLLYKDGSFIQAIEGPKKDLEQLYLNIRNDPRHHSIITMLSETVEQRAFKDWSMGFVDLDKVAHALPGFSNFLREDRAAQDFQNDSSLARQLLATFREHPQFM